MTPTVVGVIPARFGSSRFPGKPLADLWGKPLIVHVCDRVAQACRVDRLWVATDHEGIAEAVRGAGYEARMTPSDCASGTDRIAASLAGEDAVDIVVNIQGDEPMIAPGVIDAVVEALQGDPDCGAATAAVPLVDRAAFESPHVVKVVTRPDGRALYFSRAPLPSPARLAPGAAEAPGFAWGLKHLGLYAYRAGVLHDFAAWSPTVLEQCECLEQLRLLEHGVAMQVAVVDHDAIGVDTPEELEGLRRQAPPASLSPSS